MLLNDPPSRRIVDGIDSAPAQRRIRRIRPAYVVAGIGVVGFIAGIQLLASSYSVRGPFAEILQDLTSTPRSAEVYFAGLAVALVGMTNRVRVVAAVAAVVLQCAFVAGRYVRGAPFALGDGPLYVLLALAVLAVFWWTGDQQKRAFKALSIGLVLPLATKFGDTWLAVSAAARPRVLDPYLRVADHALGNPSWLVGQALEFLGPAVTVVVHVVYIELPVAAMAVAVWQLLPYARKIGPWPQHYIVRTFVAIAFIGPLFYMLFPVVGPIFAFGDSGHGLQLDNSWPNQPLGTLHDPQSMAFDSETPRNCMPSLHTAWALTIFIHSRTGPAWLRWGGTFWLVATLTATLGFGYHYGVDLVAGAVLCLTIETALRDPRRGWDPARIRLVALGAAIFATLLLSYRYLPMTMAHHPFVAGPLLIGAVALVATLFYGQFFADDGTTLARWSRRPVRG